MSADRLTENSQLILVRLSVYILGVGQQADVDHIGGWHGTGSAGRDFFPACPSRTNGTFRPVTQRGMVNERQVPVHYRQLGNVRKLRLH